MKRQTHKKQYEDFVAVWLTDTIRTWQNGQRIPAVTLAYGVAKRIHHDSPSLWGVGVAARARKDNPSLRVGAAIASARLLEGLRRKLYPCIASARLLEGLRRKLYPCGCLGSLYDNHNVIVPFEPPDGWTPDEKADAGAHVMTRLSFHRYFVVSAVRDEGEQIPKGFAFPFRFFDEVILGEIKPFFKTALENDLEAAIRDIMA